MMRPQIKKRKWIPAALAMLLAGGCASQTTVTPMRMVSGDPDTDAAAYQASQRHLSAVKWDVIENTGPRPIWDRMGTQSAAPTTLPADKAASDSNSAQAAAATQPAEPIREIVYVPTTQPNAAATTQPFVMHPSYHLKDLPVQVVELPDRRVRLIWTLQNFGGSTVTSSRDANTSRRTVTVSAPDLVPLVNVLQQQLGAAGTITPLPAENTLVITCDPAMKAPMLEMLYRLDVPPQQVEISARIFEASRDFDFQQGAKALAKRLASDNSQVAQSIFQTPNFIEAMKDASGTPFQGSVLSFMKIFQEAGISIDMSIQLLADAGMINLVSSPRMTVAAGQTGYMLAGQELPVQASSIVNGALTISTQYKPVGVQLYITPQSIGPDRVKLHTISIVSNVAGFAPLPKINGQNPDKVLVNPIIESREAETAVTVADGDTLVISGLRMARTTVRENKVPGLGDLPLLGWLFKNHRSQQQMTDLYFFVTPTLLATAE
jgi:type II secretory pathway component GspD/PulD (secretin)